MSNIFSFNGSEEAGYSQPMPLVDSNQAKSAIPDTLLRKKRAGWPTASEPELVRHYTWLSRRNFGIDTGFYPLGSCTMKHNPRINEKIVQL